MTSRSRTAAAEEVAPISATLGAAFDDDPVVTHILPIGVSNREARVRAFLGLAARQAIGHGSLWTTPGHAAAAAWLPPGRWQAGAGDMVRMLPRSLWALRARAPIGMRSMRLMEQHHPTEPHWYLEAIGTHPDHQGKGHGSALIDPVLSVCDRDGLPAYLESSKEANVPYYERFGFRVTGELALPEDGPTLWAMWRDPR